MNAYSEGLRKKILQALRRGTTKTGAARTLGVSRSSVKRCAKLAGEGLPLAPEKRPGLKRRWARPRGSFWRRTSKGAPRPPSGT